MGCDQKELASILQESLCDPHLDFGWFVGTNSSLAAALWSQFPGTNTPHPPGPSTDWLQQFPGWPGGQKERALSGPGPVPGGLSPPPTPAGGAALGPRATSQPGPRPRAARPAAPRKPQPRPAPPAWRPGSRGPETHAAMAQPETGPSTSSGRIQAGADLWAGRESGAFRLPASGLAVSCAWGSESKVLGAM